MSEAFLGAWRVHERVHEAAGGLLGTVRQERRLERAGDRVRVLQDCVLDGDFRGHPLAAFAGRHVFEVSTDGAARRYHGPAVIGAAETLGAGAMVGAGLWPALGLQFTSYAVTVAPDRQLTGGTFHRAGRVVAEVVGLGLQARSPDCAWPALAPAHAPWTIASVWEGAHEGGPAVRRAYDGGAGFVETAGPGESVRVRLDGNGRAAVGEAVGLHRAIGPSLRVVVTGPDGAAIDHLEALDAAGGHLAAIRRHLCDGRVVRTEVLRLRARPEARDGRAGR